MWARYGAGAGVGAFMVVGVAMTILLLVSSNIRWRLPNGVETVGDLVRAIAPMELADGSSGERLLARLRVLEEVRRITALQLGLELEKVRPESEFVKDLGVD